MKKPNLCILLDAATFVIKNTESTLLAPGMYFRVMLIGFFEGIESERGIAWRVAVVLKRYDRMPHNVAVRFVVHTNYGDMMSDYFYLLAM